jgi:hypothetical protein
VFAGQGLLGIYVATSFVGTVLVSLIVLLLQSCPTGCSGVPAAGRYTRNSNITSDFIDNVVTEEEHFEGYGDPKVYCSEDNNNKAGDLCFSLNEKVS